MKPGFRSQILPMGSMEACCVKVVAQALEVCHCVYQPHSHPVACFGTQAGASQVNQNLFVPMAAGGRRDPGRIELHCLSVSLQLRNLQNLVHAPQLSLIAQHLNHFFAAVQPLMQWISMRAGMARQAHAQATCIEW